MNETLVDREPPLSTRTVTRLLECIQGCHSVVISQVTQLIQEITSRADTISIAQLADLVSGDEAMIAKLLSVANTLGYNPTGVEISSVHEAIQTLGFERIRNISVALLLLESAERAGAATEKKQVSALALSSAVLAQSILESRGGGDPEQAFVSAALRSYGHLVMVNFLYPEYQQARELGKTLGWENACRKVFGLTTLEAAYQVLSALKLAPLLLQTLRPVPAEMVEARAHSPGELLLLVSDFATRFCDVVSTTAGTPEELTSQARQLAKEYGAALSLSSRTFEDILDRARSRLNHFGQAQGLRVFTSQIMNRLASMAKPEPIKKAAPVPAPTPAAPAATPSTELAAKPDPAVDARKLLDALSLKWQSIDSERRLTLKEGVAGLLEILHVALRLSESAVFLKDSTLGTWPARAGKGELFASIRSQSLLSTESKSIFSICLSRGEDLLIAKPDEGAILKHIPDWLKEHVKRRSLLLLPLRDSAGVFGVICAVGMDERSVQIATQISQSLTEIRLQLARFNRIELAT